jgi:hypothetical protein
LAKGSDLSPKNQARNSGGNWTGTGNDSEYIKWARMIKAAP